MQSTKTAAVEQGSRHDTQLILTSKMFRGLGDPTRLRILEYLLVKERSVSELVEILGVPQGRVSNHLACLRWCNFVVAVRRGKFVFYQLADERVKTILKLGYEFTADNAAHIYACTRM